MKPNPMVPCSSGNFCGDTISYDSQKETLHVPVNDCPPFINYFRTFCNKDRFFSQENGYISVRIDLIRKACVCFLDKECYENPFFIGIADLAKIKLSVDLQCKDNAKNALYAVEAVLKCIVYNFVQSDKDYRRLKIENKRLKIKNKEAEIQVKAVDAFKKTNELNKEKVKKLNTELVANVKKIETLQKSKDGSDLELLELNKKLESIKQEMSSKNDCFIKEKHDLKEEHIKEKKELRKKYEDEVSNIKEAQEQRIREIQTLKSEVANLNIVNRNLNQKLIDQDLNKTKVALEEKLKEKNNEIGELNKQLIDNAKIIEDLQNENNSQEKIIFEIRQEKTLIYDMYVDQKKESKDKCIVLENEKRELEVKLTENNKKIADFEKEKNCDVLAIDLLKKQIASLDQKDIEELLALRDCKKDLNKSKVALETIREENKSLKYEVAYLRGVIKSLENPSGNLNALEMDSNHTTDLSEQHKEDQNLVNNDNNNTDTTSITRDDAEKIRKSLNDILKGPRKNQWTNNKTWIAFLLAGACGIYAYHKNIKPISLHCF